MLFLVADAVSYYYLILSRATQQHQQNKKPNPELFEELQATYVDDVKQF